MSEWNLKRIPKIAHFYWGGDKLPLLRLLTILSFKKFNPDWEIRLYSPLNLVKDNTWKTNEQKFKFTGKDYFDCLKNLPDILRIKLDFKKIGFNNDASEVHKSDYLRWKLLSTVGGLWSDMDIIYFKSMNDLVFNTKDNSNKNAFICTNDKYHSIGFLLAGKDNLFYKHIFKSCLKFFDKNQYQSLGNAVFALLGLNKFKDISESGFSCGVGNIPMECVYPIDSFHIDDIYNSSESKFIKNNSIGLHWFAGHPLSCKYINDIDETNYLSYNNSIGLCIKKYAEEDKLTMEEQLCQRLKIDSNLKMSILITTYNRSHLLKYQLKSLSEQKVNFPFEVIVLNDGLNDDTEELCNEYRNSLDIRYIFTGIRNNENKCKWRIPGFAFNIGIKQAKGKAIVLSCAEMFLPRTDMLQKLMDEFEEDPNYIITFKGIDDGGSDDPPRGKGEILEFLEGRSNYKTLNDAMDSETLPLNTYQPFFMMIAKRDFILIGGYDEDFVGVGYDDNDFTSRLLKRGLKYKFLNDKIVHLYHPRLEYSSPEIKRLLSINKNLYEARLRANSIIRNAGREWGVLK